MSVTVDEEHARQIREYLELLDLIHMIPVIHLPSSDRSGVRAVITQPGLRHAQVEALLESLIQDRLFDNLPAKTKAEVSSRIRTTVLGRMMEDIILMETSLAMGNCKVFTIQFPLPWGIAKCSPYNFLSESSTWSYMTHLTSHVEYSR